MAKDFLKSELPNFRLNPTVGPVTTLAEERKGRDGPARGLAMRWGP